MEPLSLILGLALGLVLGAFIVFLWAQNQGAELRRRGDLAEQRLADLQARLGQTETLAAQAAEAEKRLSAEAAALKAVLEQERLGKERDFALMAQKFLDESAQKLAHQNQERLGFVLTPVRQELLNLKQQLAETTRQDAQQRASLAEQVSTLVAQNQRLGKEAQNLTQALKGENKRAGLWGEMILERVLEVSGLVKGREYEVQVQRRDDEGAAWQPDAVIHLPGGKDVILDAKASLKALEALAAAETEEGRQAARTALADSLRAHLKGLAAKPYDRLGLNNIDSVLMFLPVEGVLPEVLLADPNWLDNALSQRIVPVTPTTLLATLKTIEFSWRQERQNANVQQIFEIASALYDKMAGVAESWEKVGSLLDQTRRTYDEAGQRLKSGKGNVVSRLERLIDLGAKPSKALPATWASRDEEGE